MNRPNKKTIPIHAVIAPEKRAVDMVPIRLADPANARPRFESIREALIEGRQIAINFEASSNCNLACDFCAMHTPSCDLDDVSDGKRPRKAKAHLKRPLFDAFIAKMAGLPPLKVLYFHGHGEPLLNKALPDMVRTALTRGVTESVAIVTNGTLLSADAFRRLADAGVDEVRVSLDVITPAEYARVKGVDMAAQVVSNLFDCMSVLRSTKLTTRLTIECMNWRDPASPLHAENRLIEERLGDTARATRGVTLRWRDEFGWLEQVGHGNVHRQRNRPCEQPFYMLMIHADGAVSACCGDTVKGLVVGDLTQAEHMRDIIQGAALRAFRRKMLDEDFSSLPQCRHCDAESVADLELRHGKQELLSLL